MACSGMSLENSKFRACMCVPTTIPYRTYLVRAWLDEECSEKDKNNLKRYEVRTRSYEIGCNPNWFGKGRHLICYISICCDRTYVCQYEIALLGACTQLDSVTYLALRWILHHKHIRFYNCSLLWTSHSMRNTSTIKIRQVKRVQA